MSMSSISTDWSMKSTSIKSNVPIFIDLSIDKSVPIFIDWLRQDISTLLTWHEVHTIILTAIVVIRHFSLTMLR